MLKLTHFLHYSKGAMGSGKSGKRQSKQKGLGAFHSVVFFTNFFRQKHWVLCRFLSCYNQLLHVSYGTSFMAQSLHIVKLSIKLEEVEK